jgi:hypothetical protein
VGSWGSADGGDWKITFGANTFLVGSAIVRCFATVSDFLKDAARGEPWSSSMLRGSLFLYVRGAVANYRGDEYSYPISGTGMEFGATSIDVADFVNLVLSISGAESLCSDR